MGWGRGVICDLKDLVKTMPQISPFTLLVGEVRIRNWVMGLVLDAQGRTSEIFKCGN